LKLFLWEGEHCYIGIAETVEEARVFAISKIRAYHQTDKQNQYSLPHEQEVSGEPDKVFDLPCGVIVVNYA